MPVTMSWSPTNVLPSESQAHSPPPLHTLQDLFRTSQKYNTDFCTDISAEAAQILAWNLIEIG